MIPGSFPARLALAFCRWLLACWGMEFTPVARGTTSALFYRDPRGRFVSLAKLPPEPAAPPPHARPGAAQWSPEDRCGLPEPVVEVLQDVGVTPLMYRTAAVPLELPDDLEDVPALERCLRHWILRNLDHWVNTKGRAVFGVIQSLMRTYAITLYYYKPPRRMQKAYRQGAKAPSQEAEHFAGEGLAPSRSVPVKHNFDTWVGAAPAAAPSQVDGPPRAGAGPAPTLPTNAAHETTPAGSRKGLPYPTTSMASRNGNEDKEAMDFTTRKRIGCPRSTARGPNPAPQVPSRAPPISSCAP